MRNILATTALVGLMTLPAFGQTDTATQPMAETAVTDTTTPTLSASDADVLIDSNFYASGTAVATDTVDGPSDDWENIGTIEDFIMSPDGAIVAVVLDVGSFFDIGTKSVSVPVDQISVVTDTSDENAPIVVFGGPADSLQDLPELDRTAVNDQGQAFYSAGNAAVSSDQGLTEEEVTGAPAAPNEDEAAESELDTSTTDTDGTAEMESEAASDLDYLSGDAVAELTASDLQGTAVFDMSGEHVGNIADVVLGDDGLVGRVIVDVGGFLGIGAKPVAIAFDDLQFVQDDGGMTRTLRATTMITADQFSTMQPWEG